MDMQDYLKGIYLSLPELPGTYQFYNNEGKIIYVGKAKNLKRRVSSYFQKNILDKKTRFLVSKICDISYSVVNTEDDALLIEDSLIKQYQPKYNMMLKDDKTYPSICVSNEFLPRVFKTRTIDKKKGVYFGPYSHISKMYSILDVVRRVYKPRSCSIPFTEEMVRGGKFKPCVEFQLGNCNAPCNGNQSLEDYLENIEQIRNVLKGNIGELLKYLKDKMMICSEKLEFEKAEVYKQRYLIIKEFISKSEIVSRTVSNVDVFSVVNDEVTKKAFVNYIHVDSGAINQSFTYEYNRDNDEDEREMLCKVIPEIRDKFDSDAREIIVPFMLNLEIENVCFFVPQRGEKRHLLKLSELNARQYQFNFSKRLKKEYSEEKLKGLMQNLQEKLHLNKLPYHIECFDNSNISGSDAVAGCVVYKGLKPSRKDYRRYNIKTVKGVDDYASMREVVSRRYKRMIKENSPLPDLIITDGGKGHMEAVRSIIVDELNLSVPIAGLAKDNRHRTNELLFGFPPQVIDLRTNSELFKILTQMQDEVHRFAISFHRNKRSKRQLHSVLDDIKGIGPKSKKKLLAELRTVQDIKDADLKTLENILGSAKAMIVYQFFH
ncbi:MAG: excinuclease ABC subunit C [Prevotella micans]|nr:excinuclease ABC subunit C [Prevotella micans]